MKPRVYIGPVPVLACLPTRERDMDVKQAAHDTFSH